MRVGDVVVPDRESVIRGKFFHCGSGAYTHAVIGSVEPFVLVSSGGDMVWSCTWEPHEVIVLCQASEDIVLRVRERLERTKEHLREATKGEVE